MNTTRCWKCLISMLSVLAMMPVRSVSAQDFVIHLDTRPAEVDHSGSRLPIVFEGVVFEPDGAPAAGTVVVTSAGGKAVTDRNGLFRLETRVPIDARTVQISAFGRGSLDLGARKSVELCAVGRDTWVQVGALWLAPEVSCQTAWLPTFGEQPGVDGVIRDLAVFDDGGGPALYVGGSFQIAGNLLVGGLATWDGSRWAPVEGRPGGVVDALEVFDDGGGPALFVGGTFLIAGGVIVNNLARWNGTSWSAVGNGTGASVHELTVFDDGSGPALFVGGSFFYVGSHMTAHHVAKWDGVSWSRLGSGTNGTAVHALTSFDSGGGPSLYAAGQFTMAGGVVTNRIAR